MVSKIYGYKFKDSLKNSLSVSISKKMIKLFDDCINEKKPYYSISKFYS